MCPSNCVCCIIAELGDKGNRHTRLLRDPDNGSERVKLGLLHLFNKCTKRGWCRSHITSLHLVGQVQPVPKVMTDLHPHSLVLLPDVRAAHLHDTNGQGVLLALRINDHPPTLLQPGKIEPLSVLLLSVWGHLRARIRKPRAHDVRPTQHERYRPLVDRNGREYEVRILVNKLERGQYRTVSVLEEGWLAPSAVQHQMRPDLVLDEGRLLG
mmetsp:Transcript_12220/g.23058  ORF Transcript_12220/g.23058 Transcript_12220/m.23058 type:complete len:211 (+) Transcript_12220:122-754(+)